MTDDDFNQTAAAPAGAPIERGELAWSAEEHAVDVRPGRHWPLWAALVVILCAVTAAAVWLATVFYQQQWAPNKLQPSPRPSPNPTPTVTALSSPPPSPSQTPTVTALPPTGTFEEETPPPATPNIQPDADQQFLAMVAHIPGFIVTDPEGLITSTKVMCTQLQNGASPEAIIQGTMRNTGASRVTAETLFDAGATIYCPKYAHR